MGGHTAPPSHYHFTKGAFMTRLDKTGYQIALCWVLLFGFYIACSGFMFLVSNRQTDIELLIRGIL